MTGGNSKCSTKASTPKTCWSLPPFGKACDADRIRERLAADGIEPVIPLLSTRRKKLPYDK